MKLKRQKMTCISNMSDIDFPFSVNPANWSSHLLPLTIGKNYDVLIFSDGVQAVTINDNGEEMRVLVKRFKKAEWPDWAYGCIILPLGLLLMGIFVGLLNGM